MTAPTASLPSLPHDAKPPARTATLARERRNPARSRMILDFVKLRGPMLLSPRDVEKLRLHLVEVLHRNERLPARGQGFDWRAIADDCGIDAEALVRGRDVLRPRAGSAAGRRGTWGAETASQKVQHFGLLFGALAAPATVRSGASARLSRPSSSGSDVRMTAPGDRSSAASSPDGLVGASPRCVRSISMRR